jgi:hypothetical protein
MTTLLVGALIATNALTVVCGYFLLRVSASLGYERENVLIDRERDILERAREREDQLLNRIQAPQIAVAQSLPHSDEPGYISSFDDEALADYERERQRLVADTAELVASAAVAPEVTE